MSKRKHLSRFHRLTAAAIITSLIAISGLHAMGKDKEAPLLRHVVLFKFKESATKAQVASVEKAFAALPSKIDTIVDFEWGTDVSVEGKAKGFTHCFFVSFKDKAGRETYLPHPAHKEFVSLVGPLLEDVCVFDYFAK